MLALVSTLIEACASMSMMGVSLRDYLAQTERGLAISNEEQSDV